MRYGHPGTDAGPLSVDGTIHPLVPPTDRADRSGRAEHPSAAGVRGQPTGPAQPTWPRRGERRRVALAHHSSPPRIDHLALVRVQPPAECRADPARDAWNQGVEAGAQSSVEPPFPSEETDPRGSACVLR